MRRGLFILALFALVALSGRDAVAMGVFGTQDRINHLQDLKVQGPGGEALYLGFKTSTHAFMLPYTMSDGGYVLGIKGVSDKYYPLPKERIEYLQRSGQLPKTLPVYRRTALDYIWGYALWPGLLIVAVACFFQARGRSEGEYAETRSA